jgi:hypothetical protein
MQNRNHNSCAIDCIAIIESTTTVGTLLVHSGGGGCANCNALCNRTSKELKKIATPAAV